MQPDFLSSPLKLSIQYYIFTWKHCPGSWSAGRRRWFDHWRPFPPGKRACSPPQQPGTPWGLGELLSLWAAPLQDSSLQPLLGGWPVIRTRRCLSELTEQMCYSELILLLFLLSALFVCCSWFFWRCIPLQISWKVRWEIVTKERKEVIITPLGVLTETPKCKV